MKIKFGCVYKKLNDSFNDQHYYIYVPVIWKDKEEKLHYRMVDTYEIGNPYETKSMEERIKFLEQANQGETSWKIYHNCYDYYYTNYYELTSDELNDNEWKLICDLHDYKRISANDTNEYREEDVVRRLPLWNEDGYDWNYGEGYHCNYVRKDAKKDGTCVYINAMYSCNFEFTSDWKLDDFEKTCKECLKMTLDRGYKTKIKKKLKEIKKYKELKKEFKDFQNKLFKKEG